MKHLKTNVNKYSSFTRNHSKHIKFLRQHHLNIHNDHNLQLSHILCFQGTIIKYSKEVSQFINLCKYKYIHNFDGHCLFLLYDKNMMCSSISINHHSGSTTTFNEEHRKAIHVLQIPFLSYSFFYIYFTTFTL